MGVGLSLATLFRNKVNSLKDYRMKNEIEQNVSYPTGFLSFDYLNGTIIHVKSEEMDFTYNSVGIVDGSMVTVIGRTGCGKTTFIMQSAGEIVRPFETACIYHDDIEGGIVQSRKEMLLKMRGQDLVDHYIARNSGITAENFYERIKMIHDLKMENRDAYEYDTGLYDELGNRIYKLEPTVYILDSLALLMPEKYTDEDELSGQMSTTAAARTNASIFRRIIPMLKAANIILFVVNHISQKIEVSSFVHTKAQTAYLKQDESVGGGRVALYVSNLLIRMDDNTKLKETEGFGIHGIVVEVTILKSRTCAAGRSVNLIFDYDHGFDRELSLLLLLKDIGIVNMKGAYMSFANNEEIGKFTNKNFKEKLKDPEFSKVFAEQALIGLNSIITKPDDSIFEEDKVDDDVTSQILALNNQMIMKSA